MDSGPEAIAEASERAQVRHQARRVHAKAALLAVVLVASILAIPHT
jgi:hypothetical protein